MTTANNLGQGLIPFFSIEVTPMPDAGFLYHFSLMAHGAEGRNP